VIKNTYNFKNSSFAPNIKKKTIHGFTIDYIFWVLILRTMCYKYFEFYSDCNKYRN